jgi:hypothetical protein
MALSARGVNHQHKVSCAESITILPSAAQQLFQITLKPRKAILLHEWKGCVPHPGAGAGRTEVVRASDLTEIIQSQIS